MKRYGFVLLLMSSSILSCQLDPWVVTNSPTDRVSVTKVTRFATMDDGVTPQKSLVGTVIFSHKTHEAMGLECDYCHHKNGNDDRIKQCAKCHKGYEGYDVMHGHCLDCHMEKGGPERCMECH